MLYHGIFDNYLSCYITIFSPGGVFFWFQSVAETPTPWCPTIQIIPAADSKKKKNIQRLIGIFRVPIQDGNPSDNLRFIIIYKPHWLVRCIYIYNHIDIYIYISTINHRIQSLFEGNWTLSTGGSILWVLVCYATSGWELRSINGNFRTQATKLLYHINHYIKPYSTGISPYIAW